MRLLGKEILYKFKQQHADARSQIESWESEIGAAKWSAPQDVKNKYPKASLLKNQQVIFNICGNKYRLLVLVNYKSQIVLAQKIDSHNKYDNWDIE
ncbi:MAG: type II toxin-antitoxin system HigB family toxin [Patescibacteria group bacterium]|nr:type II toxin-antitoxin system HigB family toxin [Patescibacteria group bacterium]